MTEDEMVKELEGHFERHCDAEDFLMDLRGQRHRVVVSVEVYDPTGKSSVMRRGATLEEAVKQVREAMDAQTKTP